MVNGVWTVKSSNMLKQTENLSDAGWIKTGTVLAIPNTEMPDGSNGTVFRITDSSAAASQVIAQSNALIGAPIAQEERWCASVYVMKGSGHRYFSLVTYAVSMKAAGETILDTKTGEIFYKNLDINSKGTFGSVQSVGNYWRVSVSTIFPVSSSNFVIQIAPSLRISFQDATFIPSLTGSIVVCRPQANPGKYPYPYVASTLSSTKYEFGDLEDWKIS